MQQYPRKITGGNQPDRVVQEEIVTDPKTGTRYRVAEGKRYVIVEPKNHPPERQKDYPGWVYEGWTNDSDGKPFEMYRPPTPEEQEIERVTQRLSPTMDDARFRAAQDALRKSLSTVDQAATVPQSPAQAPPSPPRKRVSAVPAKLTLVNVAQRTTPPVSPNDSLALAGLSFDTPVVGSLLGQIETPNLTKYPNPYATPKSFTPQQAEPPAMRFSTGGPRQFTRAEDAPETLFGALDPTSPESEKHAAAVKAAQWLNMDLPKDRMLTKYEQDRILSEYKFRQQELQNEKMLTPEWSQRPFDNGENTKITSFGPGLQGYDKYGRPTSWNQFLPKMGTPEAHKTAKEIEARMAISALSVPPALLGVGGVAGASYLAEMAGLSGFAHTAATTLGGLVAGGGGTLLTDRTARAISPEWMRDLDQQRAEIQKKDPFGYAMLEASGGLVGGAGGNYGVDAKGRLVSGTVGAAMDQVGRLLRGEGLDGGSAGAAFISNAATHSSGGYLDEAAGNAGRLTAKGGVAAGKQAFRYGNATLDALVAGTKTKIKNGQLYAALPGGVPGVGFDLDTFLRSLKGGNDYTQAQRDQIAKVIRDRGEIPVTPSFKTLEEALRKDPALKAIFTSWDRARHDPYAPRFQDEYSIIPPIYLQGGPYYIMSPNGAVSAIASNKPVASAVRDEVLENDVERAFIALGEQGQIRSPTTFSQVWFWENMDDIVNAGKGGRDPNATWHKFINAVATAYDKSLDAVAKRKGYAVSTRKENKHLDQKQKDAIGAAEKKRYKDVNAVNIRSMTPEQFYVWIQNLPMDDRNVFIRFASKEDGTVSWKDLYPGYADPRFGDHLKYPQKTVVGAADFAKSGEFHTGELKGVPDRRAIPNHGGYTHQLAGWGLGLGENSTATYLDFIKGKDGLLVPGAPTDVWGKYSTQGETFTPTEETVDAALAKLGDPRGKPRRLPNGTYTDYQFKTRESKQGATLLDAAGSTTYDRDIQLIRNLTSKITGKKTHSAGSSTATDANMVRRRGSTNANGGASGIRNSDAAGLVQAHDIPDGRVRPEAGLRRSTEAGVGRQPATPIKASPTGGTAGDANKKTPPSVPRTSGGNGSSQPSSATGRKKPGIAPKSTSDSGSRGTLPQDDVSLFIDPFRVDAISKLVAASPPPADDGFYLDEFLQVRPKTRLISRTRPIA